MKLVLMSCCAPCSAGAIKQLADGQIPGVDDFIVLFFNPNIFPAAEYDKRLAEQIRYCEQLGAKYAIGEYDHAAWRDAVRGMEDAPERGPRCSDVCVWCVAPQRPIPSRQGRVRRISPPPVIAGDDTPRPKYPGRWAF